MVLILHLMCQWGEMATFLEDVIVQPGLILIAKCVCAHTCVHACLPPPPLQVESTKKSYHQARKEEWSATSREGHAKADPTKSQEEVRKYTARLERCNQEAEKVRNAHTYTHVIYKHINGVLCITPLVPVWVCLSPEKHTCICFKLWNMTRLVSSAF